MRTFVGGLGFMLVTIGAPAPAPGPAAAGPSRPDRGGSLPGSSTWTSSGPLQFLYQGMDPAESGEYHRLPRRLALLTQNDSTR
ncbi:hypothetical protein G3I77_31845 [Streptomyces sp. D2-8]|uniref:hypothetical protein n=1 Tax=Streptomyces sp. D2-8 TaxID=2707767 RepID=UPI0020BF6473|nr:hypothetical protein [Streptomyces sp. D2-8]MCK8437430.1 hypothetical protein [Streptomyces sp. D2-8]